MMFAAQGVGALVGPVLFERFYRGREARLMGAVGLGVVVWAVGFAWMAYTPTLLLTCIAVGVSRTGGGANWAFTAHGFQRLSADEYRGRIFSFDFGLTTLFMSASFVIFGFALELFAIETVILWIAALTAAFGLGWHLVTRRMWTDEAVAAAIAATEAAPAD